MTSKKGSLWKSSWNRGRGTPIPDYLGDMAFFEDFGSGPDATTYETAVPSTLGLTLPFWFAAVGVRASDQNVSSFLSFGLGPKSDVNTVFAVCNAGFISLLPQLDVSGDDFISAVLVVVTKNSPTTYDARVFLDDQVSLYFTDGDPFPVATAPIVFTPTGLPGGLHGFAGGSVEPTVAEIRTWFAELKASLKIPEIPGKTSHRYAASFVVGVPVVLPNLGSDGVAQDMTLVTVGTPPTPANVLIPVRFPY